MLLGGGLQDFVDVLHNPVEESGVDVLGERVAGVDRLSAGHGLHVGLRRRGQFPVAQPVLHLLQLHPQQSAEVLQVDVASLKYKDVLSESSENQQKIRDGQFTYQETAGLSITLCHDLHIPQVEDRGQNLKDAALTALLYTCKQGPQVSPGFNLIHWFWFT